MDSVNETIDMDGTDSSSVKRTTLRERSFYPKQKNGNSASLSVRKRKYDKTRQRNNEKTMDMIQQRSRSYFLSFTDVDIGKETWLSPAVSIMCNQSPEPISLYDDGRPDFLVDDIKQTLFTDHEIDILAYLEERFDQLPRERVLLYYKSIEPIVELYRHALLDIKTKPAKQGDTTEETNEAEKPCPPDTEPRYDFDSPIPSPVSQEEDGPKQQNTPVPVVGVLGAPVYAPAMKIRINAGLFSPLSGIGCFNDKFACDGGVLIYAGPGCGKTTMLDRLPPDVRSRVYDTDELDCIVDKACIIMTNRHELLEYNTGWLRIAFIPPKLIWNARCISKCNTWQSDWYPPPGARHADLRFSGTGFVGDYIEVFFDAQFRGPPRKVANVMTRERQ